VSEVDVNGQVLSTFTDVKSPRHLSIDSEGHLFVTDGEWPHHLSTDSEGHVFVADHNNHRILLLNSQLHLERVLLDTNSQVKQLSPSRLSYNELTSQIQVVHVDYPHGYCISCWSVR